MWKLLVILVVTMLYCAIKSMSSSFPHENQEYIPFIESNEDDDHTSMYRAIVIAMLSSIIVTPEAHLGL